MSAQQILQDANAAYGRHDWQAAIDGWRKLVSLGAAKDPSVFYLNSAFAYTNLGQYQKAIEQCDLCIKSSNKKNSKAFAQKITLCSKLQDFDGALKTIDEATGAGFTSQMMYIQKINLLNVLGRWEDAMECVDIALKKTKDEGKGPIKDNIRYNVDVALALCKLKSAEDLLPYVEFLAARYDEGKLHDKKHRFNRIFVASMSVVAEYFADRDFDISFKYYSKLIEIEPQNASLHYNRGVICRRKRPNMSSDQIAKRLEMAIENFEIAAKLAPNDKKVHKAIGNCKLMQKDYLGASKAFMLANQNEIKVLYNTGVCFLNLRKVQDSLLKMQAALKIEPFFEPALQAVKLLRPIAEQKRQKYKSLLSRLQSAGDDTEELSDAVKDAEAAQKDLGLLESQKKDLVEAARTRGFDIAPVSEIEIEEELGYAQHHDSEGHLLPPKPDGTGGATVDFSVEDKEEENGDMLPELAAPRTSNERKQESALFEIKVPKGVKGGQIIVVDVSGAKGSSSADLAAVKVPLGMKEFELFKYNPLTGITIDKNNVISRQRVCKAKDLPSMVLSESASSKQLSRKASFDYPMAVGKLLAQSAHPYIQKYKHLLKRHDKDLDPVELEIKRAILALEKGNQNLADAVELGHTKVVLTLEEIKSGKTPKDFDIYNKERYLSDAEFKQVFKMERKDFSKLRQWKKNRLKKKVGLF